MDVSGAVLSAIANQFSTTELPRKLMQKTIQMVRLDLHIKFHVNHWSMSVIR